MPVCRLFLSRSSCPHIAVLHCFPLDSSHARPERRPVRIILLSPSRNVTHFVKHGVLENFIPEICSPVNEHNKHAIAFPVSLAQVVVGGQIRSLVLNWWQPVVEGDL